MIPIQIIEVYSEKKAIRVMIEKQTNCFSIYLATKTNKDLGFPSLETIDKKFDTATNALLHIVSYFNNDKIIKVLNQLSDLLSIDEIKRITKCNLIHNY